MKKKFFISLVLIITFAASAFAASPSIVMLSTRSDPSCIKMYDVLREINKQYGNRISTARIYLENNPDIAKKYNVRFVPTLIFRDSSGKEIALEIGYKSLNEVIKIFANAGVKI